MSKTQEVVWARHGELPAAEGENQNVLGALRVMLEADEYRISAPARQFINASEAYFHERQVVDPTEELFAQSHGLTVD